MCSSDLGPRGAAGANDAASGEGTSGIATPEANQGEEVSERLVETVSVSEEVEQQAGQGESYDGEAGEEVSVEAGPRAEGVSDVCRGGDGRGGGQAV